MQAFTAVSSSVVSSCMVWQVAQVSVAWLLLTGRSCGFTVVPLASVRYSMPAVAELE